MDIESFVQQELAFDHSGHGFQHAKRVALSAQKIQRKEGGDLRLIEAASLLHDCADSKLFKDPKAQQKKIEACLLANGFSENETKQVLTIIGSMSWHLHEEKGLSKEGQIVSDADKLEALGAIGIIRTIEYGASRGREFYEEKNLVRSGEAVSFGQPSETTLSHFYEKLLLMLPSFQTKTGQQEARRRLDYLKGFLDEFYSEL